MKIKNATSEQIRKALTIINKKYKGNVTFNRFDRTGNIYNVTLKVKNSRGRGARLGFYPTSTGKRRHLTSACWHVHGDFFDALLRINPEVVIRTADKKVDKWGGNWQDWNIGSMMSPMYYSEACECYKWL